GPLGRPPALRARGLEAAAAAEGLLAQAQRLRGDLEKLVLADPLEALLEIHDARWGQAHALVRGGGAHVGQLLFLGDVDVEIAVPAVLPHDLPLVHRLAWPHEEHPTRLEMVDGVGGGASSAVRDEGAVGAMGNVALPLRVAVEE